MKTKNLSIFTRISILVFSLITALCLLFIALTYLSTNRFHQASTQLLNKDVAAHIAEFTSPFNSNGINKRKADSVFHDAMVLSPSAEVYFLDTSGKVIAFHANEKEVKQWNLPLENIRKLITSKGSIYIKGTDPRDPENDKIFSAAEVKSTSENLGYIYVILGSNEKVTGMLYNGYLGNLLAKAICVIIVLSIILSFIYLNRLQKNYNHVVHVLQRFESGDLEARFKLQEQHELTPITQAFNKMADLLLYNINRLTKSEKERKDFITHISHDLKTPLAIARGYTETLFLKRADKELSNEEMELCLQMILTKIQQTDTMVNQLFELSRVESVEFKAAKEPFVLSEIVQETVNVFQLLSSQKKVTLKCTQCQYHVWVNADVSMMERVIQNLVDNAVNNTPENGTVSVSLAVDKNTLIFRIQNTGSPLPHELLQWINNSKEENILDANWSSRSGIGFRIIKKILQLHNSTLIAYTENDSGNIFTFSLPIYN